MKIEKMMGPITLALRGISLVALLGGSIVTGAAGCQGEEAGDDDLSPGPQCPDNAGHVVFQNRTDKNIQLIELRNADGSTQSLVDGLGLASNTELTWVDCFPAPRTLVVTFADGTRQENDLPVLDFATTRLRMTPGETTVDPPPAPRAPAGSRGIGSDPGNAGSAQSLTY
jgi:hypothetical protein